MSRIAINYACFTAYTSTDNSKNGPVNGSDHHDTSAIVDEITSAAVNARLCASAEKIA
jgi:hypothetical protein